MINPTLEDLEPLKGINLMINPTLEDLEPLKGINLCFKMLGNTLIIKGAY